MGEGGDRLLYTVLKALFSFVVLLTVTVGVVFYLFRCEGALGKYMGYCSFGIEDVAVGKGIATGVKEESKDQKGGVGGLMLYVVGNLSKKSQDWYREQFYEVIRDECGASGVVRYDGERLYCGRVEAEFDEVEGLLYVDGRVLDLSVFWDDRDSQRLYFDESTGKLSITGGNSVSLGSYRQTLSLDSSTNTLSISGGNSIDLSEFSQTLSLVSDVLTISDSGSSVDLSVYRQSLSWDATTNTLSISGNNTVDLSDLSQTLTLVGNVLTISDSGSSVTFTNWDTDVTDDVRELTDLQDVTITSPLTSQVLKYNGTGWVNSALNFVELADTPSSYGTAGYLLQTDGLGNIVYVDPLALDVGYWKRTGTVLSPRNLGDDIYLRSGEVLGVGFDPSTFSASTVAAFNGRVGIGTSLALADLHILSSEKVTLRLEADTDNVGEYDVPTIEFYADGGYLEGRIGITDGGYPGFTGALSNALYFEASLTNNALQFVTKGVTRMTIDHLGRIGIATSTPIERLHVVGNIQLEHGYTIKSKTSWGRVTRIMGIYAGAGLGQDTLQIGSADTGIPIAFRQGSNVSMYLDSNANLGIGTTSPSGILDIMKDNGLIIFQPTDVTVDGQVKDSPTLVFRGKYDSDTTTGVVSSNFDFSIKNIVSATTPSGRLAFFNQGNEVFSIFSDGKVRVGNESTSFMPDLFVSGSADVDVLVGTPENASERTILRFLAAHSSDTAFIQAGTSSADTTAKLTISRLYTSSSPLAQFSVYSDKTYFSGNVGIGTTNPVAKLEVNGSIKISPIDTPLEFDWYGRNIRVIDSPLSPGDKWMVFRNSYSGNLTGAFSFQNHNGSTNIMTIRTNGNVGINTIAPLEKLHIFGSDTAVLVGDPSSGYSALRLVGSMNNGRAYIQAGVSSTDTNAKLRISRYGTTSSTLSEFSVYSDWTYFSGNVSIGGWNPGDNKTLSVFRSVDMSLLSGGVAGYFQTTLDASSGNATHYATGLVSQLYLVTSATSDLTEWDYGFNTIAASPSITGDGYVGSFAGVNSRGIYYGGAVGSHYLFRAIRPTDGSSGTATINNLYGLYIGPLYSSSSTFVGTGWGIYQAGAEDLNYFAGKLRIGSNISSNAQVLIDGGTYVLDLRGPSSEGQTWISFKNNTGTLMGSINMSGTSQNLRFSTPSGIGLLLAAGSQGRLQGSLWIVEGDMELRGNIYDPTDSLLNFTDDVSITGALNVSGNLVVNSNVLFVDALNGKVGIGTSSPSATLDIVGNIEVESSFGFYYTENFTAMNKFVYVERGDELRFKTPVSVERWNGTAWESWVSAPNFAYVTDGRGKTEVQIPNTTSKFRLTYLTDGCLTPYLLIQQEYIPDTFNVTVETSSDQITWTQRASATGLSGYQSVVNMGGGDQCEKYYRITFEITSFADSTFRLVGLQLVSTRPGSQGGLLETLLPIDWDYNKNIGLGTNAPQAKLHVVSNLLPDMIIEETGSTTAAQLRLKNVTRSWDIVSDASPDLFGIWDATSSAWRLVIDGSTGRVGIGTSSPLEKLTLFDGNLLLESQDTTSTTTLIDSGLLTLQGEYWDGTQSLPYGFSLQTILESTTPTARLSIQNNAGTELFVIDESGNVGVGTTSPTERLTVWGHIATPIGSNGNLILGAPSIEGMRIGYKGGIGMRIQVAGGFAGKLTIMGEATNTTLAVRAGSSQTNNLQEWQDYSGNPLTVVDEAGNIGIGTTNPTDKLMVVGDLAGSGITLDSSSGAGIVIDKGGTAYTAQIQFQTAGAITWRIGTIGSDEFMIESGAAATPRLYIESGGNVGINTTSPLGILDVLKDSGQIYFQPSDITADNQLKDSPELIFRGKYDSDATTGFATGTYDFKVKNILESTTPTARLSIQNNAGTELFVIDESGNVGVGTTSPLSKLHIYDSGLGGELLRVESQYLTGTLSGWNFRIPVTISNPNPTTLTDFQVKIILDTASLISAGKMRSDCGDLRITDSDGVTLLPYWIESGCNTGSTIVWTKVPSLPANGSGVVYVYYGNITATSAANGDAVFEFFDDFEGTSLDLAKWQMVGVDTLSISNSILYMSDATWGDSLATTVLLSPPFTVFAKVHHPDNVTTGWEKTVYYSSAALAFGSYNDTWEFPVAIGGALSNIIENPTVGINYIYRYTVLTNQLYVEVLKLPTYQVVASGYSSTTTIPASDYFLLGAYANNYVDWIYIIKYAPSEPTVTLGTEEVPTLVPGPVQVNFIVKDGLVGIHTNNPQYPLQVGDPGDGTLAIANAWVTFSDARYKENIKELDGSLDKILHLRGVRYTWKGSGKHDVGLIAQEVYEVIPDIVYMSRDGTLGIDYTDLIPYLVEAIKELAQKVGTGGTSLSYFTEATNNVLTTAYDLSVPNITATKIFVTDLTASVLKAVSVTIASGKLVISSDGTLTTSANVNVSGTLNVNTVLADQVKTKSLTITTDLAGKVTVKAAEMVHTVQIAGIDSDDIVVLTPVNKPVAFGVKVEDQRFTIILSQPQSEDIEFNYVVIKRE